MYIFKPVFSFIHFQFYSQAIYKDFLFIDFILHLRIIIYSLDE